MTARIGKELLSNNQKLENTVANLETELKAANEKITQLQHEVLKKTELIQILTNDVEESVSEAGKRIGSNLRNKVGWRLMKICLFSWNFSNSNEPH